MARLLSLTVPIVVASLLAGPMVSGAGMIGEAIANLPAPVNVGPFDPLGWLGPLLAVTLVGFPFGFVMTLLGSWLMIALGNRSELAQLRVVWAGVGAIIASVVFIGSYPNFGSLELLPVWAVPSAICAWICRSSKPWEAL